MGGYISGISPTLRELVTPTVDVFADGVGFNDGSSTYVDLSADPGNENNVHITFDGVTQHHDTYTVSGVRVTFDAAIPTGTSKIEARYAQEHPNYMVTQDNSITNAKMADDAIGLAELSASGSASSSTFLAGDNAWREAGGGAFTFVSSVTASNSATVSFTGLDATYDRYWITFANIIPQNDNTQIYMHMGTGSTPTYDTGTNYFWVARSSALNGPFADSTESSANEIKITTILSLGTGTGEACHGDIWLVNPASASNYTTIMSNAWGNQQSSSRMTINDVGGSYAVQTAVTAVTFKMDSGNIASGEFRLYGLNKS